MKVFVSHSFRDYDLAMAIVRELIKHNHDVVTGMETVSGRDIFTYITTQIHSADAVVAILSESNPNVYYELGLATGAGKHVLIVAQPDERLAFDLAGIPYIQISGNYMFDARLVARRLSQFHVTKKHQPPKYKSANEALQAAYADPSYLESMKSADFENLIASLFLESGYTISRHHGIEELGYDFLCASPMHKGVIMVQIKKMSRQSRVSVEAVRQLLSYMSSAEVETGMIISTSEYTAAARALGMANSIKLITINDLVEAKSYEGLLGIKKPE